MFDRTTEPTAADIVAALDDAMSLDARYAVGTLPALQMLRAMSSRTAADHTAERTRAESILRHRALCECWACWAN